MDAEGVDGHRILGDQKGGIACEVEQSSADGEAEKIQMEVWSLNHWTTREVQQYKSIHYFSRPLFADCVPYI